MSLYKKKSVKIFLQEEKNQYFGNIVFQVNKDIFLFLFYSTPDYCNQQHWHFGHHKQNILLRSIQTEPKCIINNYPKIIKIPLSSPLTLKSKSLLPKTARKPLVLDCKCYTKGSLLPVWIYGYGCTSQLNLLASSNNKNFQQFASILIHLIKQRYI